jgi:hypothetical protein
LLARHDHLIRAISHQKITCLSLLDLSAAFDTIDHEVLIDRLQSWFGIQGTAHIWLKSYLTNRTFSVLTNGNKSEKHPVTSGLPQGSILDTIPFCIYTTPLSHLLSTSDIQHHLHADDAQLFFSFAPTFFDSPIKLSQNAIAMVANWMSSNLLCLNPAKSEFMIIGLPKQLTKLQQPLL